MPLHVEQNLIIHRVFYFGQVQVVVEDRAAAPLHVIFYSVKVNCSSIQVTPVTKPLLP